MSLLQRLERLAQVFQEADGQGSRGRLCGHGFEKRSHTGALSLLVVGVQGKPLCKFAVLLVFVMQVVHDIELQITDR